MVRPVPGFISQFLQGIHTGVDPVTRDRLKRKIKKEGFPEHAPHRAFAL